MAAELNKEDKQTEEEIYCDKCKGCGDIGCDGTFTFLAHHVIGKTDCLYEETYIEELSQDVDSLLKAEREKERENIISDIQKGIIKIPSITIRQEVDVPEDVADHIRKTERERVLEEVIELVFLESEKYAADRPPSDETHLSIIDQAKWEEAGVILTKLNQLKEQ